MVLFFLIRDNGHLWITAVVMCAIQFTQFTHSGDQWIQETYIQRELRFVEVINCISPAAELPERWTQALVPRQLLHCPSGAFVHIIEAVAGQTFTTDSPCPHPGYHENKREPVAIDPTQRVKCAPTSITPVVQQLCQGMNTCDIVRKLAHVDANLECQHVAFLRVNYTCFPAYSQREVVCADSYVELSCTSLGLDASLLLLRAHLGSQHSPTAESQLVSNSKHCSNVVDPMNCEPVDVSALVARNCNRRTVCTVNPAMIVDQLRHTHAKPEAALKGKNKSSVDFHEEFDLDTDSLMGYDPSTCAKANLYLEYTCAHAALLRSLERPTSLPKTVNEKRKSEKMFQFANQPLVDTLDDPLENEQVEESRVDSIESADQQNVILDMETDRLLLTKQATAIDSDLISNESDILLISLIPSIICLILVLVLIAYIVYTRRTSKRGDYGRKRLKSSLTGDELISKPEKLSTKLNNPAASVQSTKNTCIQIPDKNRFEIHAKDRHIPWNSAEIKRDSTSLIGSVCCECSQTECEPSTDDTPRPVREGTMNRLVTEHPYHSSSPMSNSAARQALTYNPYEGDWVTNAMRPCQVCSMKSSTIDVNTNALSVQRDLGDSRTETQLKKTLHSGLYSSFPAKYFTGAELQSTNALIDSTTNWNRYAYAQPITDTEQRPMHQTSSPISPRSPSNRTLVSGKHDLYQSIIRSNSQNNTRNPNKLIDQQPRTRLAPPLFNSTDNFVRSVTESYQPTQTFRLRFNKIPVVRYPYETEDDSEDNSHSTNENRPTVPDEDMGSIRRQNRPDLCPPIKIEDELATNSPPTDKNSLKRSTLSPARNRSNYNDLVMTSTLQTNGSPSVVSSSASPDYTVVEEYKVSPVVNMSPRPYPRLLANISMHNTNTNNSNNNIDAYPSPKLNKHLRFQPPILELPCTVYDRNNLPPTSDMSTSMCRSTMQS